ncbi:MAG: hypothetical protein KVP17_000881 [Porospora cf. gigantea B]|nr:MAG: hypothetical protein KVP17_000881 [Porospora cf. gigantea B]
MICPVVQDFSIPAAVEGRQAQHEHVLPLPAMEGFAHDSVSGFHFSHQANLFYDPSNEYFITPEGVYYQVDSALQLLVFKFSFDISNITSAVRQAEKRKEEKAAALRREVSSSNVSLEAPDHQTSVDIPSKKSTVATLLASAAASAAASKVAVPPKLEANPTYPQLEFDPIPRPQCVPCPVKEPPISAQDSSLICAFCVRVFKTREQLNRHEQTDWHQMNVMRQTGK